MNENTVQDVIDLIDSYDEFEGVASNLDTDSLTSVDSVISVLEDKILNSDWFEVMYYSDAMNILSSYDDSLRSAFEAASFFEYTIEDLSSTVLATCLSQKLALDVLYSEEFRQGLEEIFAEYSE